MLSFWCRLNSVRSVCGTICMHVHFTHGLAINSFKFLSLFLFRFLFILFLCLLHYLFDLFPFFKPNARSWLRDTKRFLVVDVRFTFCHSLCFLSVCTYTHTHTPHWVGYLIDSTLKNIEFFGYLAYFFFNFIWMWKNHIGFKNYSIKLTNHRLLTQNTHTRWKLQSLTLCEL